MAPEPELSARMSATLDQMHATLRDLIASVRNHHATGCDFPTLCPGERALLWVMEHPERAGAVLNLALVELANAADERTP